MYNIQAIQYILSHCRQGDVVSSREQQLKTQLKSLQDQVREIEAERKTDVIERSKVVNKLSTERGQQYCPSLPSKSHYSHVHVVPCNTCMCSIRPIHVPLT